MSLMHYGAAHSEDSPPPCGEGSGVGVGVANTPNVTTATPLPNPPPQGGRERTEFAARGSVSLTCALVLVLLYGLPAAAQELRRATVWDLKLGEPVAAQPSPVEFRGFACGANGGPPRAQLTGFSDFARCRAEAGLHEVYFEYDDELEYIARARDLPREVARWAGTTELAFPIMASALFDADGVLRGIRIITDSRPDYRQDTTDADHKRRADAYLLGGVLAGRFDIDPARDCVSQPAAEGESAVGSLFVKQSCEKTDTANRRRLVLHINYFRKPGQSGVNPQLPTQLTQGQFESSARLEIHHLASP